MNLKEIDHLEGENNVKRAVKKYAGVSWIKLAQDREGWHVVLNKKMSF